MGIPAKTGAYNHTPGFTALAGTREAHVLCLESAKGMAIAGWKILADDKAAAQVWQDFETDKKAQLLSLDETVVLPVGGCC